MCEASIFVQMGVRRWGRDRWRGWGVMQLEGILIDDVSEQANELGHIKWAVNWTNLTGWHVSKRGKPARND